MNIKLAVGETLKGTLHFRSYLAHPRLTPIKEFAYLQTLTQIFLVENFL